MMIPARKPDPDYTQLLCALRCGQRPNRVPFLELGADPEIMAAVLQEPVRRAANPRSDRDAFEAALAQKIRFWHLLGYDALLERPIVETPGAGERGGLLADDTAALARDKRRWAEEHSGAITNWAEFEKYPWPKPGEADFSALEYMARHLPDGMGIIASPFGALQPVMLLMGYETFALALHDQRDLIQAVFERIGELRVAMARQLIEMDRVIALWLLDDMGYKTATMISPADLREFVFPIHKRVAQVAHEAGMPLLLHACGNLGMVMEDLIEDVGIDAKHSFEDVIEPVEAFVAHYGDRVAAIGGVDMDILARGSQEEVRARTREILEACAPSGSYVLGSGNTIANYIPVENLVAMLEEARRFNQE